MSVLQSKAKVVKIDKDTIGGDTYWVKLPHFPDAKPLCFRKMKKQPELRCTHPAGYRTDHLGTGACRFHGGITKTPTITTGMTAYKTRLRLHDKIQEYLDMSRDELLDLTQHLAATRAIFDEFLTTHPDPTNDESYGIWFGRFNTLIATLGTLVDKISRIDSRNTLTAAQVLYLRATMIDIFMKYIPEPDIRERAIREIVLRIGGDVSEEISMKPSEVSLPKYAVEDAEYSEV